MTLNSINELLATLNQKKRENVFALANALMEWMQVELVAKEKPPLLSPSTQKLMSFLVPAPFTVQPQLYRLSNDNQSIKVRFAVLKKLKKEHISLLVDNDPGLTSFQASMRGIINLPGREPYIASEPYFIHFVTTGAYDRLLVIINQGEQKRIIQFKDRLSNTQFSKILPLWQNIGTKSKTEITELIWKSLDVKEVNKDFYKHIKERFDAAIGIAKTQYPQANEQDVKQFAVRLIGRYIFCWFLKEKEIIPANLLASETIRKYQDNYFQTYLFNLYFDTLNEEVQSRKAFSTGSELDKYYLNIPYLNGGLFDKHPEDELFNKIDLNAWLIAFVEILESFDFTVDESSSQYQLVAIDPEMLGRIFENLLASQNQETEKLANQRKAFGAFYTPREIVDYMVNESLKAHLETHLLPKDEVSDNAALQEPLVSYKGSLFEQTMQNQTVKEPSSSADYDLERKRERLKTKIEKLFAPECVDNPFDKAETQNVRKALSEIKVLDPACGSGAFPMGVLLRLMELRQIVGHGHKNNYDLKNDILSKNIYGVDIMPMAVEIARLRAWLSLVLEADYKPTERKNNFGVSALPNLDFKFVCANSLIDSGYDAFLKHVTHNATLLRLDGEIQKLENIRNTYFDPKGDKVKKEELQQQFIETKNYIKTEFKSLRRTWNLEDFLNKVDDWNPFDDSHPSSFFSPAWMFGINKGFDVVIGNPPYVQLQKIDAIRKSELENQNYETYEKTGDLYQVFYENGLNALKNCGVLVLITSNKWMRANYGKSTRQFFANNASIKTLIDFYGIQIFDATVDTNILIVSKEKGNNKIPICKIRKDLGELSNIANYVNINTVILNAPSERAWTAYDAAEYKLIQKIENQGVQIKDWKIKINRGILTGCNEAFILTKITKDKIIDEDAKSAEIIRPILRGEDIKAYVPKFSDLYLIATFPSLNLNIDKYKGIKKHLEKFKEQIEPKPKNFKGDKWKGRKTGAYEWFETQDSIAYFEDFSKPKIIYPNMTKFLPFVYDETIGYLCNDKAFIISGERLKYLTGILNSSLWKFAFKDRFPELLGETRELRKVFFDKIPIKKPIKNFEKQIEKLVDEILKNKKSNQDTTSLEKEIDVLVYKLYELTFDEVKIIDKDFWLSEEEYLTYKLNN